MHEVFWPRVLEDDYARLLKFGYVRGNVYAFAGSLSFDQAANAWVGPLKVMAACDRLEVFCSTTFHNDFRLPQVVLCGRDGRAFMPPPSYKDEEEGWLADLELRLGPTLLAARRRNPVNERGWEDRYDSDPVLSIYAQLRVRGEVITSDPSLYTWHAQLQRLAVEDQMLPIDVVTIAASDDIFCFGARFVPAAANDDRSRVA